MLQVLSSAWALLIGMGLLMVGNGLQGSLMGIRGAIENFTTTELAFITSAYFAGFLFGSRTAPTMIRRVGHVRVFAALGSLVSAVLILYPTITDPWAWVMLRVIFGFCFSGVYVTAESWLNESSTNETRGKALSLYMIVQMLGIITGQALLNVGDPGGYLLFVIPSVLVSLSFAPILLSASRSPSFDTTKPMALMELFRASPTGFVGMAMMGGIFSAQFGMASVWGSEAGLTVAQISVFVSAIFFGGLLFQWPIGFLSDRMDRRVLILGCAIVGAVAGLVGWLAEGRFELLVAMGFVMGGVSNPLYALIVAYTNDYLQPEDMAAASGGLLFVNGLGAIFGPIVTGWLMAVIGPGGFWVYILGLMVLLTAFILWRMTRRESNFEAEAHYDAVAYAPVMPSATAVAWEAAQEVYAENVDETDETSPSRDELLDRDEGRWQ